MSPAEHPHLPEGSSTWPGGQLGRGLVVVLGAGGGVGL